MTLVSGVADAGSVRYWLQWSRILAISASISANERSTTTTVTSKRSGSEATASSIIAWGVLARTWTAKVTVASFDRMRPPANASG